MLDLLAEHQQWLTWLGAISAVTFVGTLALVPILVARIPSDYFTRARRNPATRRLPQAVRLPLLALKNLLGLLLLLMGIAMLVLPGQGILTMIIGLMLMNFPGKFRLECWLVGRPAVLKSINWLRARRHRPPITPPPDRHEPPPPPDA